MLAEMAIIGMTLLPAHYTPLSEPMQMEISVTPNTYEMCAEVTAYTTASDECGKDDGITASGEMAIPNETIAVDPRIIPLGSMVYIPTRGWLRANDTGGAIQTYNGVTRIDLCVATKAEAYKWGRRKLLIIWIPPNSKWNYSVYYPKRRERPLWMKSLLPTLTL